MTDAAIAGPSREEGPAILATLIRQVGDFSLAEDALQDAFAAAVATWPRDGVPASPGAWITTTARRKAIDRLRRERGLADRIERLAILAARDTSQRGQTPTTEVDGDVTEEHAIGDDRLRLLFTCCHPALALEARVALTVKSLGGLTTAEVARAFLVSEPTMYQRLTRAKRKIAAARIPYRVPPRRAARPSAATASWPSSTSSSTRATRRPTATASCAASSAARRSASAACWSTCCPATPRPSACSR